MTRREFYVTVEIKFTSVSCPGVHLPVRDDVILAVSALGQSRQSESVPAVFPLLLHEKMTFEKIFRGAVDPADVAVMLQHECVRVELLQLTPPVGDLLAVVEQDARSFLFPEPRLVPSFSGQDREVLMRRVDHFPGISPRLEFSCRTWISESSADAQNNKQLLTGSLRSSRTSSRPRTSPERRPGGRTPRGRSSRITSRSRSLSRAQERPTQISLDFDSCRPIQDDSTDPSPEDPDPAGLWRSQQTSSRDWEEVQARVCRLLSTPAAVHRLLTGATHSEVEDVLIRRSISPGPP